MTNICESPLDQSAVDYTIDGKTLATALRAIGSILMVMPPDSEDRGDIVEAWDKIRGLMNAGGETRETSNPC